MNAIEHERSRPVNPAFRAAYLKGMSAGVCGGSLADCPYDDKRKPSGRLSWSRAFQNAWRDGFNHAIADREQALITLAYSRPRDDGRGR